MSEPKLISPMLDSFDMGAPISDHDGVRCCPAMRKDSADKYIVKIISVPASQTKLDALLLTGAYPDKEAALAYFKDVADGIADEKKILDELSGLEGFAGYEDCQIVPMEDGTGYDVYLLAPYRTTLERKCARTPLTQLEAVNLGLDVCSALAICRRSGYMYVDIRPENIVSCVDKEFRIADLGFINLSSLQYASLPDKYRSPYTAPEVEDAFSTLNSTLDIYAIGMVLYQVYNGGRLPVKDTTPMEPPVYADEEIAQVIMKAIAADPAERWQDPVEMGQALVSYMQKNSVNDTPLTAEFFATSESADETEGTLQDVLEEPAETFDETETLADENVIPIPDNFQDEANVAVVEEVAAEPVSAEESETEVERVCAEEPKVIEELAPEGENAAENTEQIQIEPAETEATEESDISEEAEQTEVTEEADIPEEDFVNISLLDDEEYLHVDYDAVSADVSDMLEQIEELAAHQVPEPAVAPEAIEIKLPDPPVEEIVAEESKNAMSEDNTQQEAEEDLADDEELPEEERPYIPKKKRTGLVWCIVLLLVLALGVGGYFFYQEYYLQPIHTLVLEGSEDRLQVQLTADIDETYLTVICADSHGNRIPAPVVGGTAVFTGLAPDTAYTVSVEVDGLHKLTGVTSKVYSTPIQTKIAQISAVTGSESGSVILSFAIEGPDSAQWNVIYNADGEAERVTAFPAHTVTLTGLTVGKEYTFRIEPVDDIFLSGDAQITYVARELISAENLQIAACADGLLTVRWDTPEGKEVSQWSVRCYNENGYDETVVTAENTVTFENIDDTNAYTIDVTAELMSVNQRIVLSANSITATDFTVDSVNAQSLRLAWNANREIPAEGWTLRYSVDGVNAAQTITSHENAVMVPALPGEYVFTLLDGAGNPVLGGPFVHTQPDATSFDAYSVTEADMTIRLCKTPAGATWSYKDLEEDDYVNSFSVGQKISVVTAMSGSATESDDEIITVFAIYDENDNLVNFSHSNQTWRSMWYENYCELDIPVVPTAQGTYTLVMYFNGQTIGSQKFMITA